MNRLGLPVAVLLLVAGCLGERAGESNDDTLASPSARTFRPPVIAMAAADCSNDFCGEASIAWGTDGLLVVTSASGTAVARSQDDGRSFTVLPVPAGEGASTFATTGGSDAQLQQGPDGRVWLSMLILGQAGGGGGGVRVLSTEDGGLTWRTDTMVMTNLNPVANAADRQWLAFHEGTVYLLAVSPPAVAPVLFASDDGGQAFESRGPILTTNEVRWTPWGLPTVLPNGRIIVPFFGPPCPTAGLQQVGVHAADSDPGSVTGWTSAVIDPPGGPGTIGCFFPFAANNGTHVAVAWNRGGGTGAGWNGEPGAAVAFSRDGLAWSEPIRWGTYAPAVPHPWIAALPDGRFALLAYDDADRVRLLIGGPSGVEESWSLGNVTPGRTDLPNMAVAPDGRIAAVWIHDDAIWVAVEEAAR
jgi:hypothetical protein